MRTEGVLGGTPRISGHRIGVYDIVELVLEGEYSVRDVVREVYPQLTDDEAHAAIEYYYHHPEEIDAIQEELERLTQRPEAISGPDDVPADVSRWE